MLKIYKKSDKNSVNNFYGSRGAGILLLCPEDNTIFLVQRSSQVNEPGSWGVPGGKVEDGEELLQAAKREAFEEVGGLPSSINLLNKIDYKNNKFSYTTFIFSVSLSNKKNWRPVLNWESSDYDWFSIDSLPSNLHFGVKFLVNNLTSLKRRAKYNLILSKTARS